MAGAAFTGDMGKLDQLVNRIDGLMKNQARLKMNKQLGQESVSLVHECFERSRSPAGIPWKGISYREGQPLLKSGRLRNSINARASSEGFVLSTDVVYAAVHQYGHKFNRAARTELRAYSGGAKRKRLSLFTKRSNRVIKGVSIGASSGEIVARPYLPDAKAPLPARWRTRFSGIMVSHIRQQMEHG